MIRFKDYSFHCPHCQHELSNHDGSVIIKTMYGEDKKLEGTMFLSPVIGDYNYRHEPDYEFEQGTLVNFLCPKCDGSLTVSKNEDFSAIVMKVTDQIYFDVYFSRKAGMHKTYVVTENGPETYGEGEDYISDLG